MSLGGGVVVGFGFGLVLVVHPLFHPLPGLTHFLWSCPKKVRAVSSPKCNSGVNDDSVLGAVLNEGF
ncbi:hypothetical protein DEE77_22085, partial [Ralstonia pickettii]|uniref:hypothetical protein n=1 Tax=Ralstonia pickettii TaxID=329 RepID=UPI001C71C340